MVVYPVMAPMSQKQLKLYVFGPSGSSSRSIGPFGWGKNLGFQGEKLLGE